MSTGMEKLDILYSKIQEPKPLFRYPCNSLDNISAGNKKVPYIVAKSYEYQIKKHMSLKDGLLLNNPETCPIDYFDELEAVAKFLDTYSIHKVYVMESDSHMGNFHIINWFADNYKNITIKPIKDKSSILMEISW